MLLAPIAVVPVPPQVLLLGGLVNLCPQSPWHQLLWPALARCSLCRVTRWSLQLIWNSSLAWSSFTSRCISILRYTSPQRELRLKLKAQSLVC